MPDNIETRMARCAKGKGDLAKKMPAVFNTNDRICPFSMWFEVKANVSETMREQEPTTICELAGKQATATRINDPQTKLHYRPCKLYD